jgi:hypothetical protein
MRRLAGLLLVVSVGAGACGSPSSTESAPSASESTAVPSPFCAAWVELYPADDGPSEQESPAAMEAWMARRKTLLVELEGGTPPEHRADYEELREGLAQLEVLLTAVGYDIPRARDLPPDELEAFREQLLAAYQRLYDVGVSGLAAHAFRTCPGAHDPAFYLPCTRNVYEDVGGSRDPVDPSSLPDPDQTGERILERTPSAVEARRRDLEDGVVEYAFVGADGVAVKVVQLRPTASGWWERTSVCPEG